MLVELDKIPGVKPVVILEIWRRVAAKVVLEIVGGESKATCGKAHLYAGLGVGIDGTVHTVKSLWEANKDDA